MTTTKPTTTAARKPKKGDVIFVVGVWASGDSGRHHGYNAGSIWVREVVVESFGKVQGTFRDATTGEMIRERVYNGWVNFYFPGDDAGRAAAVAHSQADIDGRREGSIRFHEGFIASCTNPDVRTRFADELTTIRGLVGTPARVETYAVLHAEVIARVRADLAK